MSGSRATVFAIAASIAVAGAVVAGMFVLGSPAEQRARRLDQRRLDDLRNLARGVEYSWRAEGRLPPSLAELPMGLAPNQRDPGTGRTYDYSVRSEKRYQLCATFERDNSEDAGRARAGLGYVDMTIWTHGAGRNCFELEPSAAER